ncbi:MAG: cation:proton antiporter [Rhodobacteraceae bacterium]|nr:cation:proton antiporter [Paracoccaceae bacterium]
MAKELASLESMMHLAIIWAGIYVAVFAAEKTRLTPVLFYLAIGCLLVNAGVLPTEEDAFIRGFAELGIILIMFAIGFEEQTNRFVQSIKKSWGIALFGAIAPFVAAYAVAEYFWGDANISLMCGLTMTATAVSLTMVSLKSEGLGRSSAATRIMTSAVLDDIASLVLVAIMVPIVTQESVPDAAAIATTILQVAVFFVIVTVVGAWVLPIKPSGWFKRIPLIGDVCIYNLLAFGKGQYAFLAMLLLAVAVGLLSHAFGFHPAVGAYMAGLIIREEYFSTADTRGSYGEIKNTLDLIAFSIIGPVFFVTLGTKLVFDWQILMSVIPHMIAMTVAVFVLQIASAALAARYTSDLDWPNSMMVGFGMLGRAELAFVVMDIAYVQYEILSTEAFYTLMTSIFWLNVAVPVTISLWKPHCKTSEG